MTLAAFMRCIFNAFAYGAIDIQEVVMSKLRSEKTLRRLTQLCFTTNWIDANVGAKYLRLARMVVHMTGNFAEEKLFTLCRIICAAAREILQLMFTRMKNEDKAESSCQDSFILFELASFCCGLCKLVPYLPFVNLGNPLEEEKKVNASLTPAPGDIVVDLRAFLCRPQFQTHGVSITAPQYQCADYFLRELLPYKTMYTFILMIFYYSRKLNEIM